MTKKLLVVDETNALSSDVKAALLQNFDMVVHSRVHDVGPENFPVAVVSAAATNFSSICSFIFARGIASCVVIIGADPSLDDAIMAIRAGAADFITDTDDVDAIVARVGEIVSMAGLRADLERLRTVPPNTEDFPEIMGESESVHRLKDRLKRAANSDVSILITGESGTGKDIVARALHQYGRRPGGPLIVVNCSAVPGQLMESEFFGYVRGAFTGANSDRTGFLVEATGGTIYLDEIAEMPLELQTKLLRALQEKKVRPLGQGAEIAYDARLIASSSGDLEKEVAAGRFRKDLYFRLNVVRLQLPPLRERDRDVLLLAQHFIRGARSEVKPVLGFTPAVARSLMRYSWPGNVRELQHCITAAVTSAQYDHITTKDLPVHIRDSVVSAREESLDLIPLHERERLHILEILQSVGGNKSLAARHLGLDRKTLARKLRAYKGEPTPRKARVPEDSFPD